MNTILLGILGLVATCVGQEVAPEAPAPADSGREAGALVSGEVASINARDFFDLLVARYRSLTSYSDLTSVVQIMRTPTLSADGSEGEKESHRVETRLVCNVLDGELRIVTPGSQLRDQIRRAIGLNVRVGTASPRDHEKDSGPDSLVADLNSAMAYQIWLAPHMSLLVADEPLKEFRPGVPEGFTATEAGPVTIDERVMVHVELKSGDGTSKHVDAHFDLYVNPESMLIERIEGRQRLPDGGSFETSMTITPLTATSASQAPAGDHEPLDPHSATNPIDPVKPAIPAAPDESSQPGNCIGEEPAMPADPVVDSIT